MIDLRLGDVSEVEFVRSIDGEWTQFQSNVTALAQHAAAGHNIPPVQVAAMVSKGQRAVKKCELKAYLSENI